MISFSRLDVAPSEYVTKLNMMRSKLEEIVPPSYKIKYRTNDEQIIASTSIHSEHHAQRMTHKMEELIRSAAYALKIE